MMRRRMGWDARDHVWCFLAFCLVGMRYVIIDREKFYIFVSG